MADYNRLNGRRPQQSTVDYNYMVDSGNLFRFPIYKRAESRMGSKLIIGLFNGLGITAFIWGILANIGDWKSAVLFGLGALYACARFVVYCIKS